MVTSNIYALSDTPGALNYEELDWSRPEQMAPEHKWMVLAKTQAQNFLKPIPKS